MNGGGDQRGVFNIITGSTPDELDAAIRADWAREGTT